MSYQSVVIIGAARSGTNMLRDVLTSLAGVETWPCDEIPFVWRHGNARVPHDQFTPQMARPAVRRYIRGAFDKIAKATGARFVVEKTCANSMRVGFVHAVVPEAKLVYLVRDGRDTVASAMKRWVAPLDVGYLLRKARFVPISDFPYFGAKFVWNRVEQQLSSEKRLSTWGPRFAGMTELARQVSLVEVCAHQWARSVERAEMELDQVEDGIVHRLRYEDFVDEPVEGLRAILEHLGIEASTTELQRATAAVSPRSVGKGRRDLSQSELDAVHAIAGAVQKRNGYALDP